MRERATTSHDPLYHKRSAVRKCWSRCTLGCGVCEIFLGALMQDMVLYRQDREEF